MPNSLYKNHVAQNHVAWSLIRRLKDYKVLGQLQDCVIQEDYYMVV